MRRRLQRLRRLGCTSELAAPQRTFACASEVAGLHQHLKSAGASTPADMSKAACHQRWLSGGSAFAIAEHCFEHCFQHVVQHCWQSLVPRHSRSANLAGHCLEHCWQNLVPRHCEGLSRDRGQGVPVDLGA